MSEFKVGDLVRNEGSPFFGWFVTRIFGDGGVEVTNQSGGLRSTVRAEYITPAQEKIEWGPWVDGPDGFFIVTSRYQSECEHGRVIRYRLPLPKPEPVVTVRNQRLRFDEDGDLLWSLGNHPSHFRARVTRTTLDGKTTDVKIEVLK